MKDDPDTGWQSIIFCELFHNTNLNCCEYNKYKTIGQISAKSHRLPSPSFNEVSLRFVHAAVEQVSLVPDDIVFLHFWTNAVEIPNRLIKYVFHQIIDRLYNDWNRK